MATSAAGLVGRVPACHGAAAQRAQGFFKNSDGTWDTASLVEELSCTRDGYSHGFLTRSTT